ncbi:DUF4822 domain-containing protein [Danxiaibacter flavus]|uniref:DUF4822 domain-containing protein n=1 Tax=Danxiaibacter flavus TaxID=3049108 RepID=A0ABV3ZJ13_9BACT|nr:DUF4822 domain-containing protein [Chitinophagaceae bacterium DXS]
MNDFKKIVLTFVVVFCTTLFIGCSKDSDQPQKTQTPAEVLASVSWETTNAKNNKGEHVALTDANVSNFVGFAYFKADGTFTMYNLDDSPKTHGDWTVPADGKTRTIVARDSAGAILFTRVVEITVLTKDEFTYRIYPNNDDKSVYFDIVHTPTTHKEP